MMQWYRITKYDPAFRDNGIYTRDEWTSISDVGKTYNGVPFSMDEYVKVESNYIACVKSIMRHLGVTAFAISALEVYRSGTNIENVGTVSGKRVDHIMKACLREDIWCVLLSRIMTVRFGYDYYMYVQCDIVQGEVVKIAAEYSLYAEPIVSDFFDDD